MQGGRDRACTQVFGRGVAAGLFGAILCFAAGAASAQESTKTSTQAATKASAQAAAKAATRAATKASTQAATKASAQASTKAATKVSAQAATKASAQESAKASTKAATKASAQETAKTSVKASAKASTKASTKVSAQAATKASAQASSTKAAAKAPAQASSAKASAKAATQASSQAWAKASPQDASAQLPLKLSGSQLEPVKWTELAGWTADDHLAAFAAYRESCRAARKTPRADDRATISAALWNVCRDAMALRPQDADTARAFFERNFQPVRIARLGEAAGLLTGYFEPIVAGSRLPSPEFHVPVYRRPRDLVAVGYKPASVAFPNKGVRIARRTANNELLFYNDPAATEAGALDGQKLEICWIKDPLDLLAIQI